MGKILVTGGTGYVGSHVCAALINAGYSIVILDNLQNSRVEAIGRMEWITGKHARFYRTDVRDEEHMRQIFVDNKIDAVVHLAGNQGIEAAEQHPLELYDNEVCGCVALLQQMQENQCNRLIYASGSAASEEAGGRRLHSYENAKTASEELLRSICQTNGKFSAVALRFSEVAGAHESGLLGESFQNASEKLFPALAQAALEGEEHLTVPCTARTAAAQEYLHVMDLAAGFVAALGFGKKHAGFSKFYLGTGTAYNARQIADAYEKVCGKQISIAAEGEELPDAAGCSEEKLQQTNELLGWQPVSDLAQICQDSWRFAQQNPNGIQ